jgi:hypothetical protein
MIPVAHALGSPSRLRINRARLDWCAGKGRGWAAAEESKHPRVKPTRGALAAPDTPLPHPAS